MVFIFLKVWVGSRLSIAPFLGFLFDELSEKLKTLRARFTRAKKDYYSADYPDDWTL